MLTKVSWMLMTILPPMLIVDSINVNDNDINAICGHPGLPAFGRLVNSTFSDTVYKEGDNVYFQCNSGYYMNGASSRLCLSSGLWSSDLPICDTNLGLNGLNASSSQHVLAYPPELAIDGNTRSCFYTSRHSPKWWRLDMMANRRVLSVAITVPFASSEYFFTVYVVTSNGSASNATRCSTFNGIFVTQTNVLVCDNHGGIEGRYIYVEDDSRKWNFFGLCEVKVFAEKDHYQCGLAEKPLHSKVTRQLAASREEYTCLEGYVLQGSSVRECLPNGRWSGTQPVCREVTCSELMTIEHGTVQVTGSSAKGRIVHLSQSHYLCESGYVLEGNNTRSCEINGSWSGQEPQCHPVDCGLPESNGLERPEMVLLTGSSTFGSLAQLKCPNGQVASEGNTIIECLENGTWSLLLANCQFEVNPERMQRRISGSHGRNIDSRIGTILCSVIFGILFCILVLVAFLFKKKILLIKFESDKRRKQSPRVSGSTLKRTNEYKGSKVVLSEFRCSLPMATSSMGPVRRLTSGHNEEKIYQEINDKGVQSSSSSKRPYSPKTLAFDRECLAAVEQNVPHSLLEEKIEKVESPSITLRPDCDLLDDEHSESSEDGSDPSSVLYAEIDIQKRTKPLPELPIEDEPATGSTSIPLEPYVVIDNAIYSGHPMVRRPSARF